MLTSSSASLAAPSAENEPAYAVGDVHAGRAPTFTEQNRMTSVRRVGPGRYCLCASVKFSHKTIASLTPDLTLSGGKPGLAVLETRAPRCQPGEVGVVTYEFTAAGVPTLSNAISFIANPEG